VPKYLKLFTFLPQERVEELIAAMRERPEEREAQRVLARDMTAAVHGQTALDRAEQASKVLFGGEIQGLSAADIAEIFADVPSSEISKARISEGISIVDLLADSGLSKSRGEARRSISEGGISINNQRVGDAAQLVTLADAVDGQFIVLRKGRKTYQLVKLLG